MNSLPQSFFVAQRRLGFHDFGKFTERDGRNVKALRAYSPDRPGEPPRTAVAIGLDAWKEAKDLGAELLLCEGDGPNQRVILSVKRADEYIKAAFKDEGRDGSKFAVLNWRDLVQPTWADAPRLM